MSNVQGLKQQQYQLGAQPFSKGGEGEIYNISNQPNRVAKIYHPGRISQELESKLKTMVVHPPSQAVLSQVAWPLDVLYDSHGQFCGFIMPKLDIDVALRELYEYPPQKYKSVSTSQKITIAQNICAVISEVHKAGYVFGDFNPLNIGVNLKSGRVAFLDTDSYHIYDQSTSNTYRCKVCLDGYVAPELLKACENYSKDAYATAPLPTFTKETDYFALAIHIFKLLMNGYTPYNGIPETMQGSTASPGVGNDAIKRDNYCFKPGNKPQAVAVPPLDVLSEEIVELFTRAFMFGKLDPKQRPTAVEWYAALGRYEQSLQPCHRNSAHQYRNGLSSCPLCEADQRYINAVTPSIHQRTFSTPVTPSGNLRTPTGILSHIKNMFKSAKRILGNKLAIGLIVTMFVVIGIVLIGNIPINPPPIMINITPTATYTKTPTVMTKTPTLIPTGTFTPTTVPTKTKIPTPIPTKIPVKYLVYGQSLGWRYETNSYRGPYDYDYLLYDGAGDFINVAAWSPDGSQVAFIVDNKLHLVDSDGNNHKILYNLGKGWQVDSLWFDIVWSRDGQKLYFVVKRLYGQFDWYPTINSYSFSTGAIEQLYKSNEDNLNDLFLTNDGNIIIQNVRCPNNLFNLQTANMENYKGHASKFYNQRNYPWVEMNINPCQ